MRNAHVQDGASVVVSGRNVSRGAEFVAADLEPVADPLNRFFGTCRATIGRRQPIEPGETRRFQGRGKMREPDGFHDYVAARQHALVRAAYLMTGDRHLAEDLVQTALARAWSRWTSVSRTENPDAYVHRILVNTFIAANRRRWRAEVPVGDRMPDQATIDPYSVRDVHDDVLTAVRSLPPRQRAVVALRYFLDQSEAATAAALGCEVGTVKSQAAKALTRLRAVIEPDIHPAEGNSHAAS
jgi:RNA polymerase sigma-70 factor (sigma-E family)